jgi:predicted transcriptional regulator
MADAITVRTDEETEHALDVLTNDGSSQSAAAQGRAVSGYACNSA